MKKARLKHHADVLAHMACGWRIIGDLHALARLGSGLFEIDALTGTCLLNGEPYLNLDLAQELTAWLRRDAEENGIPFDHFQRAQVTLQFTARVTANRSAVTFDRIATSRIESGSGVFTADFKKNDEPPYLL